MKITPEDMDQIIRLIPADVDSSGLRMALTRMLEKIWDRGYTQGQDDGFDAVSYNTGECPHDFAHTRHWCGYAGCRDS